MPTDTVSFLVAITVVSIPTALMLWDSKGWIILAAWLVVCGVTLIG